MISDKLLKEVDASRRAIQRDVTAFKFQIDLPSRAQDAIRARPARWLGGAAVVGFIAALVRPKRRRAKQLGKKLESSDSEVVNKSAKSITAWGILLGIFKAILPLARPALTAFAAKRFADMASKL